MMISSLLLVSQGSAQDLQSYVETLPKSAVKITMIPIPAGKLNRGGKSIDIKPFFVAETETTWEAFDTFLTSGPPSKAYDQSTFAADVIARPSKSYILPDLGWGHAGYPAINVSATNVEMFCRWISKVTGKKYRLPTDTEWEYACLAGANENEAPKDSELEKSAWYEANSKGMTHPVKKKAPNAWGLYDMYGNAGEWCLDEKAEFVLCGGTFKYPIALLVATTQKRWEPAWQETDPQMPKSRWWLSDGSFVGFRIVCEP